jgi:hypothetical protein
MSEALLQRNINDGFLEEGDTFASTTLAITDFGYLAVVHTMESGKRVIEVTNISTEDGDINIANDLTISGEVQPNEDQE